MKRCALALVGFLVSASSACSPSLDINDYDRTCVVDDDCITAVIDDVCNDCAVAAINVTDSDEYRSDLEAAQRTCIAVSDCVFNGPASCQAGLCVVEPAAS